MRLLRQLVFYLSLLSLLCCATTCAAWVRSHWAAQYLGRSNATHWNGVLSMQGLLRIEHGAYAPEKPGWSYVTYPVPDRNGLWPELNARDRHLGPLQRLGFGLASIDYYHDGKMRRYALYLPHWAAALLFAIPPAIILPRALHRRRQAARGFEPLPPR
jgi:hypothetical protein